MITSEAPSQTVIPVGRRVPVGLVGVILVLNVCAIATYALSRATEGTALAPITRDLFLGFEFTNEHNIPAWIASMLWAALGVLGIALAMASRSGRIGFAALGVIGLFASLDEYAMIHERLSAVGDRLLPDQLTSSIGAWVIPGLVVALIVGAVLLRFVLHLPRRVRNGLFLGAAVFLVGALGTEALWWAVMDRASGEVTPLMLVLSAIEENLEMLGVAIAISALISLLEFTRTDEGTQLVIRNDLLAAPAESREPALR
ncbi:hypothetical protein [Leucobacter sp. GX24907]